MNAQTKLRTANILMLLGIVPLLVGIYWMFSTVSTFDPGQQGQVGDLLLVIGKMGFAYLFALVVSGTGLIWFARLSKDASGAGGRVGRGIRIFVLLVLLMPMVLRLL